MGCSQGHFFKTTSWSVWSQSPFSIHGPQAPSHHTWWSYWGHSKWRSNLQYRSCQIFLHTQGPRGLAVKHSPKRIFSTEQVQENSEDNPSFRLSQTLMGWQTHSPVVWIFGQFLLGGLAFDAHLLLCVCGSCGDFLFQRGIGALHRSTTIPFYLWLVAIAASLEERGQGHRSILLWTRSSHARSHRIQSRWSYDATRCSPGNSHPAAQARWPPTNTHLVESWQWHRATTCAVSNPLKNDRRWESGVLLGSSSPLLGFGWPCEGCRRGAWRCMRACHCFGGFSTECVAEGVYRSCQSSITVW